MPNKLANWHKIDDKSNKEIMNLKFIDIILEIIIIEKHDKRLSIIK